MTISDTCSLWKAHSNRGFLLTKGAFCPVISLSLIVQVLANIMLTPYAELVSRLPLLNGVWGRILVFLHTSIVIRAGLADRSMGPIHSRLTRY